MPKKEKKKKKPKISKEEKARAELQNAADVIKSNGLAFKSLINRMEKWFEKKSNYLLEILQTIDDQRLGCVNYVQFKAALLDIFVPCNNAEIYLITTLLDRNCSEKVNYTEILYNIQLIKDTLVADEDHIFNMKGLEKTKRDFDHCPQCQIAIYEPGVPSAHTYVLVHLRLIPLLHVRNERFHMKFISPTQHLVQTLVNRIQEDIDVASTNIVIFRENTKSRDTLLPLDLSIEECGYTGGTYNDPPTLILYYDYRAESFDSPILLSDDFFMYKTRKKTDMENQEAILA